MIYPSGLIMGKVYNGMKKIDRIDMPGINLSAIRAASTVKVNDAGEIVQGVYAKFDLRVPNLAPIIERNSSISVHIPSQLNISYFHPDHLGSSSYINYNNP